MDSALPLLKNDTKTPDTENGSAQDDIHGYTPLFHKTFQQFSRFGLSKKNRDGLSLSNLDKWLKQANIISGNECPSGTSAMIFKEIAQKKRSLNLDELKLFLLRLAKIKKTFVNTLVDQLANCGTPGITKVPDYLPRVHVRTAYNVWRRSKEVCNDSDNEESPRCNKVNCAIITEEMKNDKKNLKIKFAHYSVENKELTPFKEDGNNISTPKRIVSITGTKFIKKSKCLTQKDNLSEAKVEVKFPLLTDANNTSSQYLIIKHKNLKSIQDLVRDINHGCASSMFSRKNGVRFPYGEFLKCSSQLISDATCEKRQNLNEDITKRRLISTTSSRCSFKKGQKSTFSHGNVKDKKENLLPVIQCSKLKVKSESAKVVKKQVPKTKVVGLSALSQNRNLRVRFLKSDCQVKAVQSEPIRSQVPYNFISVRECRDQNDARQFLVNHPN